VTREQTDKHGSIASVFAAHPVLGWKYHGWLIVVAIGLFCVDWATKQLVLHYLNVPVSILGSWVQLELLFNPGAAFSLGESFTVVFAVLALLAVLVLVVIVAPRVRGPLSNIVVGLLIAGVAGNLVDRIFRHPAPFHGYVIDWIGVRYFAVFNVADMCITAAAISIVIALLRSSGGQR